VFRNWSRHLFDGSSHIVVPDLEQTFSPSLSAPYALPSEQRPHIYELLPARESGFERYRHKLVLDDYQLQPHLFHRTTAPDQFDALHDPSAVRTDVRNA
jgi:hypothetical protein